MFNMIDMAVVLGVAAMWLAVASYHHYYFKRSLLLAARARTTEKIGDDFYFIVEAEEFLKLYRSGLIAPEHVEQYHVDAAVAWLKNMGAGFYAKSEGEHHISHMDLVRTVVKAVREAERP